MTNKTASDETNELIKKADPKLREALKDVMARSPAGISVEVEYPAGNKSGTDPWSGNVYKYSF